MDVAIEELVTQSGVSRAPGCEPWSEFATWSRTWDGADELGRCAYLSATRCTAVTAVAIEPEPVPLPTSTRLPPTTFDTAPRSIPT